jgi:hypothetical protein
MRGDAFQAKFSETMRAKKHQGLRRVCAAIHTSQIIIIIIMHIAIFIVNQNGSLVYHKVSFLVLRIVDNFWGTEILDK